MKEAKEQTVKNISLKPGSDFKFMVLLLEDLMSYDRTDDAENTRVTRWAW